MLKPVFRTSEYCATCHKVSLDTRVNGYRWLRGQNEYDNWHDSGVSLNASRTFYLPPAKRVCQDCHMPREPAPLGDVSARDGTVRSHRFLAVNTALPFLRGDQETIHRTEQFLQDGKLRVDIFALKRGERMTFAPERHPSRVVAGEAYAEETVQPVLHRYNDAKYIWSDTSAREWLDGFVRAHDPTVPQAERRVVAGARARGALDGAHGPAPMRRVVIDLELEEGAEARLAQSVTNRRAAAPSAGGLPRRSQNDTPKVQSLSWKRAFRIPPACKIEKSAPDELQTSRDAYGQLSDP